MTSYFIIEKGIVERLDLSIYEKMCCVILAKWATEDIEDFDMEMLAEQMSCTVNKAKETIRQLKQKGFIESEGQEVKEAQPPRIIKAEDVEGLEPILFDETPKQHPTKEELIADVREIISEPINDSEAKIILNFAGDDLEKIKFCYKKAVNLQVGDKIEALMMELQRKEKPPAILPPIESVVEPQRSESAEQRFEKNDVLDEERDVYRDVRDVYKEEKEMPVKEELLVEEKVEKKPWYLDDNDEPLEEIIKPAKSSQINTHMIHKMKAYKKYGK